MSKHTPEPWEFESEPQYCSEIIGSNGDSVCTFVEDPSGVDVDRILSCVNACAGMTYPAAEIAELKALSVKNILLDVTPGDGSGLEVYAKSAADVNDLLCKMDEEIAELKRQRDELMALAERLAQWDLDYPVNCYNGYAGLQALNAIIRDNKVAITKGPAS